MKNLILPALLLGLSACKMTAGEKPGEAKTEAPKTSAPASAAAVASAAAPATIAAPKAPEPAGDHGGGADAIKWAGPVQWRTWEEGLAEAQRTQRGICLVVYADWCPRCKELAPVFAEADVVALAEKLVMVRQDSDQRPAWLEERYGKFGGYVPRVFFLKPDGTVREDLTSGHAQYPYFFTPRGSDKLKDAMRRLAEG